MGWSGLIYAAIVAGWAAVLVPRWVRRNEEAERAKAADALAGVRIIERRDHSHPGAVTASGHTGGKTSGTTGAVRRHVLHAPHPPVPDLPPRVAAAARDETGAARLPVLQPARPVAASGERRRSPAARRRRVLGLLSALLLGCVVGTLAGVVPAGFLLVAGLLLAGFVVVARAAVRRETVAQRARGRSRGTSRSHDAHPADVAGRPDRDRVTANAPGPAVPAARAVGAPPARESEQLPADRGSWEPVPVPLPTYVTAPKAPRVIRRIDLSTAGAWTASAPAAAPPGGPRAEEHDPAAASYPELPPLVAAEPADDADDGYEHRRAVGD